MEKAHRRVAEGYLVGHYSSYKQSLREARRAFCCGNWLNGPPKQTSSRSEIYAKISSDFPMRASRGNAPDRNITARMGKCKLRHDTNICTIHGSRYDGWMTRDIKDDEGDDRTRYSSSRLQSQLSTRRERKAVAVRRERG